MEGIDCKEFYMEYINNYITIGKIAHDYGIAIEEAFALVEEGSRYFN
jgi:hypothetical protein